MSNDKNSQIGVLLVTGLLAILGTVAGGVIKGYWDTSLAEKKFQTDLVMKSLESEELEARIISLRFMIETNLISDQTLRTGIEEYLEKKPNVVPQFKAAIAPYSSGIIVPSTDETVKYTDYDVFVCDTSWNNDETQRIATSVIDALLAAGRIGQVRLRKWSLYNEVPIADLQGKVTIIVDKDHGEAKEVPRLKQILEDVKNIPEIQIMDNPGKKTTWLISIVICSGP